MSLAAALAGVLGADPPRRACLSPDGGGVREAREPGDVEVVVLSRVCELARAAAGLPVWPRDTGELLALAAAGNAPGAWAAVHADLTSGAATPESAAAALAAAAPPEIVVRDLLDARTPAQVLHLTQILACVLPRAPGDYAARCGVALGDRLRDLVDVLVRLAVVRDVRDASLTAVGKLLDLTRAPAAAVTDELLRAVDRGADQVARLFVHAPLDVAARPQLPTALLARARAAPPSARYAYLAILVRLARGTAGGGGGGGGLARGTASGAPPPVRLDPDAVADLVASTLEGYLATRTVDARVALAASMLARCLPPPRAPAERAARALAETLELACATVLRGAGADCNK